jgi:hypothetical protein
VDREHQPWTTHNIGGSQVHHGPMAGTSRELTGMRLFWCCGERKLTTAVRGGRVGYDDPHHGRQVMAHRRDEPMAVKGERQR